MKCDADNRREANLLLVAMFISPYRRVERLADSKTNTNSDTDNEQDDHPLDDPAIALTEMSHAGAAVLCLCGLGLLLPVILSRPNLAVCLSGGAVCLVDV